LNITKHKIIMNEYKGYKIRENTFICEPLPDIEFLNKENALAYIQHVKDVADIQLKTILISGLRLSYIQNVSEGRYTMSEAMELGRIVLSTLEFMLG